VQQQRVTVTGIAHRQHDRIPIGDERDVGDEPRVEDRVELGAAVPGAIGMAADPGARPGPRRK
jgi:hypothetical protein